MPLLSDLEARAGALAQSRQPAGVLECRSASHLMLQESRARRTVSREIYDGGFLLQNRAYIRVVLKTCLNRLYRRSLSIYLIHLIEPRPLDSGSALLCCLGYTLALRGLIRICPAATRDLLAFPSIFAAALSWLDD
jgi:hypothetical protein